VWADRRSPPPLGRRLRRRPWLPLALLLVGLGGAWLWFGRAEPSQSSGAANVQQVRALTSTKRDPGASAEATRSQATNSEATGAPLSAASPAAAGASGSAASTALAKSGPVPAANREPKATEGARAQKAGNATGETRGPRVKPVRASKSSRGKRARRRRRPRLSGRSAQRARMQARNAVNSKEFDAPDFDWENEPAAGRTSGSKQQRRSGRSGAKQRNVQLGANSAPILD